MSATFVANTWANARFTIGHPPAALAQRGRDLPRLARRSRAPRCSLVDLVGGGFALQLAVLVVTWIGRGRRAASPSRAPRRLQPAPSPTVTATDPRIELAMSSTTLIPPADGHRADADHRRLRRHARLGAPRIRRLWRGPETDPGVGAARALRAARRHRGALPVGARRVRLGELVLLGRGAGRDEELEGVLLRLDRRVELHHDRQDARVALADGDLGPHLRRELVVDPRPAGARRASRWSAVLYATVKRWFSPGAALLAGAVAALTPVAALMFRFNNPDALLVLLLVGARRTR